MGDEGDDDFDIGTAPSHSAVMFRWTSARSGEEEIVFNEERALAALLIAEVVFVSEGEGDAHILCAICNDVFMWGCADADAIPAGKLQEVYEYWHKDPAWGVEVWCMKLRGMLPQRPVYDRIKQAGIWDLDSMGLRANWYDAHCAKLAAERRAPEATWEGEGGLCHAA